MGLREWWQNRTWDYLGYTKLKRGEEACFVHFFAWRPNQKKRRFVFKATKGINDEWETRDFRKSEYYQINIVPWLEGGALWDPIKHPKAVRGTLIDKFSQGNAQNPAQP